MAKQLLFVLVSAALTSAWWATAMFATGKSLFFPCALVSGVACGIFLASHWDDK